VTGQVIEVEVLPSRRIAFSTPAALDPMLLKPFG
jgi:hypothetical protein